MKTFLLIALSLIVSSVNGPLYGQSWYRNYEKYWWYRYRLVNDFMKVGPNHGESIPAYNRRRGYYDPGPVLPGYLQWGDATQALGHYLAATATEYKILENNSWSTSRTSLENYQAQNAFERLDKYAETYCNDIHGTYPNNGSPVASDLNGFFIRDDVDSGFVLSNYKHFNRPGIINRNPVGLNPTILNYNIGFSNSSGCGGPVNMPAGYCGAVSDYSVRAWLTPAQWGAGYCPGWLVPPGLGAPPQYPVEESQDQLAEIFSGMALSTMYLGSANYAGQNLQQKAADNAYSAISWAASGNGLTAPWVICNPLTSHCEYGVETDQYFNVNGCSASGAEVAFASLGMADAMNTLYGCSSYTGNLVPLASPYATLFQVSQLLGNANAMFQDNYVAFARDWYTLYLPIPLNFAVNTSWNRIQAHAWNNGFQTPHIPLIYLLNYPGASYHPLDDTTQGTYQDMLNSSTFCGNYSYNDDASNWANFGYQYDWSGQDRLAFSGKRGDGNNADFNGLDYMELFNLYVLNKNSYLQWIINPYYTDSFAINYPDVNGYGSASKWLRLNYLEYLSAIDTVKANAHLTFHGAKVIELLPGFNAEKGAVFTAYVKDIDCRSEDYHYAQRDGPEGSEYLEYNPTGLAYQAMARVIDPDVADEDMLGDIDNDLSPDAKMHVADSLIARLKARGRFDAFLARVPDSLKSRFTGGSLTGAAKPAAGLAITPNPNTGSFTISFTRAARYDLEVINAIGKSVFRATFSGSAYKIDLGNASAGNYTVRATSATSADVAKITVVR